MADSERMKAAFNLFDPDGDGKITQEGLKNTLKTLGREMSDAELRSIIGSDVEGLFTARDGKIDFETFCKIYSGELKKSAEPITDLQEAFRLLDPKGKGYIDATVLKFICARLGEDLSQEEVCMLQPVPRHLAHLKPYARLLVVAEATAFALIRGSRRMAQVSAMVGEALIGFDGRIFYDGLLKILITQ